MRTFYACLAGFSLAVAAFCVYAHSPICVGINGALFLWNLFKAMEA